tara:strand:+ start:3504 stop:3836 length:333 start_codon:yes stop_codon:yes gene_type:complete
MNQNDDRRKVDGMQILEKFVFPAIMVAGTAVFSVQMTLSTMSVEVDYIKRDLERQAISLTKVTQLQLDVIALQIEVKNANANMMILSANVERLRDRLNVLENNFKLKYKA